MSAEWRTDTFPHNMIEEMRNVLYASRLMAHDPFDLRTSDIFDAATFGGAAALQHDDIGRLEKGAKADLVMVDVTNPSMRPVRDPIRSMVYAAAERGAVLQASIEAKPETIQGRCWIVRSPEPVVQRLRCTFPAWAPGWTKTLILWSRRRMYASPPTSPRDVRSRAA